MQNTNIESVGRNGLSKKHTLIALGVISLITISTLAVVAATPKTEEKPVLKSPLEIVLDSQIKYDQSQTDAKKAMVETCNEWKAHALNKIALAEASQITINLGKDQVLETNCELGSKLVPVSF